MIRINMFSQADSVQGQGVGSAYRELVRLLRSRLVEDFYVTINKYGASDLTHYHTINPTYFANSFLPSRGRKIGYVHFLPETLEGSVKLPEPAKSIFYKYVIDFYKRMDQIVVVNPIFIDKLVKYGISKDKVKYIPNFVAKSEFYEQSQVQKNAFRNKLHIPLDKFVIVGDGQVQERKGVDGIVPREELVSYLNIADLFLLPSFDELFPMSVLEAFSCNTPVLLRDLDLYQAIIDGYYMKGKDFTELNAQIKSVVSYPEKLKKYQDLSAQASQEYSEDHLAKIWHDFYMEQYEIGRKLGQIK